MSEFVVRQRYAPERAREHSLSARTPMPTPAGAQLRLQPRYGLPDGRVAAVEAALLYPAVGDAGHHRRNLVGDGAMLRRACRLAADGAFQVPALAMSVTGAQAACGMLDRVIAEAVAQCGLPTERLELEFCADSLQVDQAELRRLLPALQALGIRIVLAGYGTSICGLALLRRRGLAGSLSGVKLDWTVMRSRDPAMSTTCGLIAVAHALGLSVIATGIEDEADARRLRAAGCDQGLGAWLDAAQTAAALAPLRRLAVSQAARSH